MLCVSLPGLSNQQMTMMVAAGIGASSTAMAMKPVATCGRYDFDGRGGCWSDCGKGRRNYVVAEATRNASSALTEYSKKSRADFYKEVLEAARDKFTREISFQSKDKDISLAKALLYVAAEDEAFLAFNREMDAHSIQNERKDILSSEDAQEWGCVETMPMAGKNINEWLAELDAIAKEVEAELVPREIGCDLVEVLNAVNKVLFESRGFERLPVLVDSKCSYLHSVLSSGRASAILLSVIYIEELFKVTSGHSLFGVVNGKCVDDPRSRASDITSNSLLGLDIATNRDIIGIALANLIRLHWKRASRTNYGLMLTSPLRSFNKYDEKFNKNSGSNAPLLRRQELRLAIMASERLLILQPHNWALRRDYGMMLYYNREYEAAVQELSICMAFAPEDEAEVLEPFVEKLHLMRLETSWKSFGQKGRLTVP
ncbi:UNVERIFIED_CONTAM: hypothetical protein Sradi_6797600 [Sesamum radiatum]|uniref:Protein SirB1 N-terminal domain-containing protein n=1 Tax=Sesamum radiatum TaxID=300843 RepID=A0AAW2JS17_SESRA